MHIIPRKFNGADLRGLRGDNKWQKAVLEYAGEMTRWKEMGVGLLLSGPPGVGKTWAIAALTSRYVARDPRADFEFLTAPDLFDNANDIEKQFDSWRDQSWLDTLFTIPWLVLNDLGKENRAGKLAELTVTRLGRVLRARTENNVVTHITTNFKPAQLKEVYGESIASLLTEMTTFVAAIGEDRRPRRTSG